MPPYTPPHDRLRARFLRDAHLILADLIDGDPRDDAGFGASVRAEWDAMVKREAARVREAGPEAMAGCNSRRAP
jgi:hypothetical protein